MDRTQLEQLVRAVARIAGARDVVVIGSAAVLASVAAPTGALEPGDVADVFVLGAPDAGSAIDDALGVGSMYESEHDVAARAVGPLTPVAPEGWLDRLVPLEASVDAGAGMVGEVLARCMAPADLVLAKLAVGRGKDIAFAETALSAGLVEVVQLFERIELLPLASSDQVSLARRIEQLTR